MEEERGKGSVKRWAKGDKRATEWNRPERTSIGGNEGEGRIETGRKEEEREEREGRGQRVDTREREKGV